MCYSFFHQKNGNSTKPCSALVHHEVLAQRHHGRRSYSSPFLFCLPKLWNFFAFSSSSCTSTSACSYSSSLTLQHRRVGDYVLTERIGQGSFSKVFKGISLSTGKRVAIKAINLRLQGDAPPFSTGSASIHASSALMHSGSPESLSGIQHHQAVLAMPKFLDLVREVVLQLRVPPGHPNIMPILEIIHSEDYQFVVMPYADHGNLLDHLEKGRASTMLNDEKVTLSDDFVYTDKDQLKVGSSHAGQHHLATATTTTTPRPLRISEYEACFYFRQILAALDACHALGIYHRDIKLENLLLVSADDACATAPKRVVLTDFGLGASSLGHSPCNMHDSTPSSSLHPSRVSLDDFSSSPASLCKTTDLLLCKTCCGTPLYASPEVLSGKSYAGHLADIWSAGVVLYMLVCGEPPFKAKNLEALYSLIRSGSYMRPMHVSRDLRDLFERIFVTDPSERISIREMMYHPWLNLAGPDPSLNDVSVFSSSSSCYSSTLTSHQNCLYSNITAISYDPVTKTYNYKAANTLYPFKQPKLVPHPDLCMKSSQNATFSLKSAKTASFEDIDLTEIASMKHQATDADHKHVPYDDEPGLRIDQPLDRPSLTSVAVV